MHTATNRNRYTSVTEIVTYGKDIQKYFTKDHATRGILIHSLCEALMRLHDLQSELDFLTSKQRSRDEAHDAVEDQRRVLRDLSDTCMIYDLAGYCSSADRLMEVVGIKPIIIEKRLFNEEVMLCGKIDFFGHIKERSTPGIVDFKTSHNTYPEWGLQLAGYWLLCEANGVYPQWAASVRIRRHGKDPITNILIEDREEYKRKCDTFLNKLTKMRQQNDQQSDFGG